MKIANLLKTAQATGVRMTHTESGVRARQCPNCQAARPDDTDLRECAFCGHSFMALDTPVHAREAGAA